MKRWAVFPALLTLGACSKEMHRPLQIPADCQQGFDVLKARILAAAGPVDSPASDPFPTYFVDRGRAYYSISTPALPGHPMIFYVTQTADGANRVSGCGFGDRGAYEKMLHDLAALGPVD